jgi:hypothetical protein
MFLRSSHRKKDGKDHRYFSVVENRRVGSDQTVQRTVLYLGEINDQQQAAWRKSLEVFDESQQRYTTLSLFPEDRPIPADAVDGLQVKLSGLELRRPRVFGSCWLGCELWRQTGAGRVLARALAGVARSGELGEGAAAAGGESTARSRQRIPSASPVVLEQCHGRVAGRGLRGG